MGRRRNNDYDPSSGISREEWLASLPAHERVMIKVRAWSGLLLAIALLVVAARMLLR